MPREKEKEEEEEASRHVILFFGRLPTPGKCKTRLARDVRDETLAARLYKSCAERVLKRFRRETVDDCDINGDGAKSSSSRCSFRLVFYVAEKEEVEQVRAWLKESLCLPKVSVGDDEESETTKKKKKKKKKLDHRFLLRQKLKSKRRTIGRAI